jgi:hypothetical protein
VAGLRDGSADLDGDGDITVDELLQLPRHPPSQQRAASEYLARISLDKAIAARYRSYIQQHQRV